jgi:hypothetical protein
MEECTFQPATITLKDFKEVNIYKKPEKHYKYITESNSKYNKIILPIYLL